MDTRESRPCGGRHPEHPWARTTEAIVDQATDETHDRPRCAVVGVYCEALGWLRREPLPDTVCCRHYWAAAEVA